MQINQSINPNRYQSSFIFYPLQHNITQHGMLPQYPTTTTKLIYDWFKCGFNKAKKYSSLMMVLGPKHVGAVLMCKFYISALVGIIIE